MAALPPNDPSMADPAADPSMGAPDADAGAESTENAGPQGYCIEIHVSADGKISVGVESEAEESSEEQGEGGEGGEPSDDNLSPAKDIKDALTQALAIYKADGAADATQTHAKQIQSQGFESGYNDD
jgi:hypothetical protein